jgi:membrane-bound lytic murein transglycosylase F
MRFNRYVDYLKLPILFIVIILSAPACSYLPEDAAETADSESPGLLKESLVERDLSAIKESGKLVAITSYSSTSFFVYRGKLMGFEYELLQWLADYMKLELEVKIASDMDELVNMLNRGDGDIIAHNLTVTTERKKYLAFTEHHATTKQVLVQRKPDNWRKMRTHEIKKQLIESPIDLIGEVDKTIHVRKNTSYSERLRHLEGELGGVFSIQYEKANRITEDIIRDVADGKIDFTVADNNFASLNAMYYPNLDISVDISLLQRIAWAVRKNSPELHDEVSKWVTEARGSTKYNVIYSKYFKSRRSNTARIKSEFFSKTGSSISPYDDIIKQYADSIGWDWRLLASQIYQESKFKPSTRSWAGAVGLMQILPETAKDMGYSSIENPELNIQAGVAYITYLTKFWEDIPEEERLNFVLASYNAGPGHISDARRLATKYGKNPDFWNDNVDEFIIKKSSPEFYNDEVVRHGYCRGQEPSDYVSEITERFSYYSQFILI